MNKLVLIGNGFDMAHGLPTSYKDFIDDFWENFPTNYNDDIYTDFISFNENDKELLEYGKINNYNDLKKNLGIYCQTFGHKYNYTDEEYSRKLYQYDYIFRFQNRFFKNLNLKCSIENWVDIENEYFNELKKIISEIKFSNTDKKEMLVRLNEEFEQIKNLFEKYLTEKVLQKFDFRTFENLNEYIRIKEILKPFIISKEPYFEEELRKLSKEFSFFEDEKEILNY